MADKIIIDGINVEDIEKCEFCTRICKNTKETTPLCKLFGYCSYVDCYFKQLKRKEQECEQKERDINRLKKCVYDSFKIQEDSERCWKKECNKLTQKLKEKEQECESLKSENFTFEELVKMQEEQIAGHNVIIDRFLMASGKSKDITEAEEFEEVFEDIEQTYSECEELKNLFKTPEVRLALTDYKQALDEIEEMVRNYDDWDLLKDISSIINKAKDGE